MIKYSKKPTQEQIVDIRTIGRKSVNAFTSADIKKTEYWSRIMYEQLGVKSPFFRAWFGDWRAYDKTPISIASKIGANRESVVNYDTGWNVNISGKVFAESGHVSKKVQEAKPYLDYLNDIVKNAVLLNTFSIGKEKSANTLFMHSLYAVADIGKGPEILKLYVEEMNDPNSTDTSKRT